MSKKHVESCFEDYCSSIDFFSFSFITLHLLNSKDPSN